MVTTSKRLTEKFIRPQFQSKRNDFPQTEDRPNTIQDPNRTVHALQIKRNFEVFSIHFYLKRNRDEGQPRTCFERDTHRGYREGNLFYCNYGSKTGIILRRLVIALHTHC